MRLSGNGFYFPFGEFAGVGIDFKVVLPVVIVDFTLVEYNAVFISSYNLDVFDSGTGNPGKSEISGFRNTDTAAGGFV